ncbi:MAG: ParA family protein [Pseudomonadota bacterium]|nr:ParA family protein [Pseudomonadota bacterium]MDQ3160542.1 ParA family protein [Pseudomonadota bacterium]
MKTWLVACSKGGVGKTTIATHLAAEAAVAGQNVVLVDADPQGSATRWCQRRAGMASAVLPVDGSRKSWQKHVPEDAQRVIVDAPAGAMGPALERFLDVADAVIVPIQPSALDIEASIGFLESLAKHPRVRKGKLRVGLVGNRLKPHTNASQQALDVLRSWPFPVVAELRDSQSYVVLTGLGKSLFDFHSALVRDHQADWAPLLHWLRKD